MKFFITQLAADTVKKLQVTDISPVINKKWNIIHIRKLKITTIKSNPAVLLTDGLVSNHKPAMGWVGFGMGYVLGRVWILADLYQTQPIGTMWLIFMNFVGRIICFLVALDMCSIVILLRPKIEYPRQIGLREFIHSVLF